MRIAVTGSAGNIGRRLCPELAREHDVLGLDLVDADRIVDVCDLGALRDAFAGCEAVVHLGGVSNNEAPWEPIYAANIGGTYNAYEAARLCGVRHFIFASSNHAVGQYEVDFEKPEAYRGASGFLLRADSPLRPDGYYGVSKAFGEALGRYYSDAFGMRVACVRIGSVTATDTPEGAGATLGYLGVSREVLLERLKTTWMSHRDFARLVLAILAHDVPYAIVYGVGDNPNRFWDLEPGRVHYGFWPLDGAVAREV